MSDQPTGRLAGRVAVVTGGASGIGFACAKRFVDDGASVVLADLDETLLAQRADELGESAATIRIDATVEEDCAAMVDLAVERFGRLDIGVNAAGLGVWGVVPDLDYAEWARCVRVCLDGVFLSAKHEGRVMREAGSGVIINIASINARVPAVGMAAYCSAKAGVEMFTRCAAMDLGPSGVRVVGIGPGLIDTPLTGFQQQVPGLRDAYLATIPMGRVGTVDDVADVAAFLASDDARWISGDTVFVDGAEATNGYPNFLEVMGGG